MKKLLFLGVVILGLSALMGAQTADVYWTNYYSNVNTAFPFDQFVRVTNPGLQGTPIASGAGTICADIYVFDSTQEMLECCHCRVTSSDLLTLSVRNNLLNGPLTGFPAPNNGVIQIVADARANCNEQAPTPVPDLRAWGTHLQMPTMGIVATTETPFAEAPLSPTHLQFLGQACAFVQYLGSGRGVCTCPTNAAS